MNNKGHLRHLADLSQDATLRVLELARALRARPSNYRRHLDGRSIAVIFAKPSTRTRVSFEVGIHQLGAQPLILQSGGAGGLQRGRGESVYDTAQVLSRYVDAIVIRTFEQEEVEGLAEHGSVPVINALTDMFHPCQALADAMTIQDRFGLDLRGRKLVYAGAGNNVAHSLMLLGPRLGIDVVCACPEKLAPSSAVLETAQQDAAVTGTQVRVEHDLMHAAEGADILYTDTWVSMGEEAESRTLMRQLNPFQITDAVMDAAHTDAVFMHCLPAHRGQEVTASVMDGPRSVVFDQAENRLHSQKALLLLLLGAEPW